MTKYLVAVLLSAFAVVSFAQGAAAPAATTAATAKKSTHHKHAKKHAPPSAKATAPDTKAGGK